jgi:hypothetical protein
MKALFLRGEGVIFGGGDGREVRLSGQNIDSEGKKKKSTVPTISRRLYGNMFSVTDADQDPSFPFYFML